MGPGCRSVTTADRCRRRLQFQLWPRGGGRGGAIARGSRLPGALREKRSRNNPGPGKTIQSLPRENYSVPAPGKLSSPCFGTNSPVPAREKLSSSSFPARDVLLLRGLQGLRAVQSYCPLYPLLYRQGKPFPPNSPRVRYLHLKTLPAITQPP